MSSDSAGLRSDGTSALVMGESLLSHNFLCPAADCLGARGMDKGVQPKTHTQDFCVLGQ